MFRFRLACSTFITALSLTWTAVAVAYTPQDQEVREMILRGMKALEGHLHADAGGQCLIALPFVKAGKGEHPQVARAVERAKRLLNAEASELRGPIYSPAVCLIFFCELDPHAYRSEIGRLVDFLLSRQQSGGAWGYADSSTGDTSQTQYGILALWKAKSAGMGVPNERIERALSWLVRTQDVDGGFGYQAVDPGQYQRVRQGNVTLGLTAAGVGSI